MGADNNVAPSTAIISEPAESFSIEAFASPTSKEQLNANISYLLNQNPGKLLYSIQEAADVFCTSYEFVRDRISNGRINSTAMGGRRMIHITEIAKIISGGV